MELTRRGKAVAVLVSLDKWERLRADRPRFAEVYGDFIGKYSLEEIGLDEGSLQVPREKGPGREVSL